MIGAAAAPRPGGRIGAVRALLALLAALLLAAGAVPRAHADFAAPVVVAAERAPWSPAASGAPDGRVVLAWARLDGGGRPVGVSLAVRSAGATGRFEAPVAVAASAARDVAVAIGENGHVAVAWTGQADGLSVRRRTPGGELGATERLFSSDAYAFMPAVGVDDAGNTIVAWTASDGELVLRWAAAGQGFGPPQVLGSGIDGSPSLAITGTGRALVGFSATSSAGRPAVVVESRIGAAAGPRRQLAADAPPAGAVESAPRLAVARGQVLATWTRGPGGGLPAGQVMSAALDAGGVARAQRPVYSGFFISTTIALAPRRALIGWIDPADELVGGVVGAEAATLGTPFRVLTSESQGTPLAGGVDSTGNAVLMWTHQTGGGSISERIVNEVRAATIPHDRTVPCAVTSLASGGTFGSPVIVMDDAGGGLAAWSEHRDGSIVAARWSAAPTSCPGGAPVAAAVTPLRLVASRTTVRVARRPVVRIALRCAAGAASCRGPATLRKGTLTLATGRLRIAAGKRGTLVLKPGSRRARERLRRAGSLSAVLRMRLATPGAPSRPATLTVRLRIRR